MLILPDVPRLAGAAAMLLAYAGLCAGILVRARNKRRRALQAAATLPILPIPGQQAPLLLAFASQSGFAEELAERSATALRGAGQAVRLTPLADLALADLRSGSPALFVVSTCGEGDPPDNAATFVRRLLAEKTGQTTPLRSLTYGLLALGDREYRHFCGFGRNLDTWLQEAGATPLFERIEVNNGDATALERWRHALAHVAGYREASGDGASSSETLSWLPPKYSPWRLAERRHLNPGSQGEAVFHLELCPPENDAAPSWESGDLLQVAAPGIDGELLPPRDYSIASIPSDGRVHLLIRQQRGPDGRLGAASGWLSTGIAVGGCIMARLRPHRNFRLGDNIRRPLILIGNGTGMAGLRGHLRARRQAGARPNWLLFGERNAACDYHYREEIEDYRQTGLLQRLDLAFSRDQADKVYIQDYLRAAAADLHSWLAQGAALYVCGNAVGMAEAVHQTLAELIGVDALDRLMVEGRYRRDVY